MCNQGMVTGAILLTLCAPAFVLAQQASRMEKVPVLNEDFEQGNAGGVPEGWTHRTLPRVQGHVALSVDRAHTGQKSVKLEAKSGEGCVLSSTPVPCVEGQPFRASCYVFNEASHSSLYIKFQRGGYDLTRDGQYVYEINKDVGKWSKITVEMEAPTGAETARVDVYVPISAYSAHYFDSIELWRTPMAEERSAPSNIGSKKELFTDDFLIADKQDVEIVLNPGKKHPGNPLLRVEKPWEGWRVYLYGCVLFDGDQKLFKMWYIAVGSSALTCYATSKDGIHWDRPALDLPDFAQYGEGNNVVGRFHLASVHKDKDEPDPAKRYKMICWSPDILPGEKRDPKVWSRGRYNYCTMVSPDGIQWAHYSSAPIAPHADVITGCYDEFHGRYIAFPKTGARVGKFSRRSFNVITSKDFNTWTEPILVLTADRTDDETIHSRLDAARPIMMAEDNPELIRTEFYGLGMMPYESVCLGFVWVFSVNNTSVSGRNQDGPITLQLACSRDLVHWHRCGERKQIIEQGIARTPPNADWDSGMITTANRPIIVGDKIWLYYGGHNITHGDLALYRDDGRRGTEATGAIGLATWRLDGFMSVNAADAPGTLTTKPLIFEGDQLTVNVDARGGSFAVEILDAKGKPVPGFGKADCDVFTGDAIRHTVTWRGNADVSRVKGNAISLRFHLKNAKLHAYQFAAEQ